MPGLLFAPSMKPVAACRPYQRRLISSRRHAATVRCRSSYLSTPIATAATRHCFTRILSRRHAVDAITRATITSFGEPPRFADAAAAQHADAHDTPHVSARSPLRVRRLCRVRRSLSSPPISPMSKPDSKIRHIGACRADDSSWLRHYHCRRYRRRIFYRRAELRSSPLRRKYAMKIRQRTGRNIINTERLFGA